MKDNIILKKLAEDPMRLCSKVYGAVLGKAIGVRLGIPYEFSTDPAHDPNKLDEVTTFPLNEFDVYPDDDTNGFYLFSKAFSRISSAEQISTDIAAELILEQASEDRGMFWWGKGFSRSTESKAYHNLINGVPSYESGNYAHNGFSADTVGGQIFYDAAGILFPGDPERAAKCAGTLAKVTHAGEGRLGAKFMSACISQAFIDSDIMSVICTAMKTLPTNSHYYRMIRNIIYTYKKHPYDWHKCMDYINEYYNEHAVWDYASHVVMALLYGGGDFNRTMEICLKSHGDTDCNCGNAGAIIGALVGCEGISSEGWAKPMNDRLQGSLGVVCENDISLTRFSAQLLSDMGRLNGIAIPEYILKAAEQVHFSFAFPYSTQGFESLFIIFGEKVEKLTDRTLSLEVAQNVPKTPSGSPYALRVWTDKFRTYESLRIYRWFNLGTFQSCKYEPTSCTAVYPGQRMSVNLFSRSRIIKARFLLYSSLNDELYNTKSESSSKIFTIEPGKWTHIEWTVSDIEGYYDCMNIEFLVDGESDYDGAEIFIDDLRISDTPNYSIDYSKNRYITDNSSYYPHLKNFSVPMGEAWWSEEGFVCFDTGTDNSHLAYPKHYELSNERGYSLAFTGEYLKNCTVSATISPVRSYYEGFLNGNRASLMVFAAKGITRHMAAGFYNGRIAILRAEKMPGEYTVLASAAFDTNYEKIYEFRVYISSNDISFTVSSDGSVLDSLRVRTKTVNEGCIGFAGIQDGIKVYKYSVEG